jgi:hypothetical protein
LLPSASAWDTPDIQWKNRTLDPFYTQTNPFGLLSHFKDFMDLTTRGTVSVVGTTIHEDFFEPRPCHSQGHSNPDSSQRTTSHLAVDGTKTTPKAKRKALALEFLQPNLVVIQKLLYRLYYLFSSVSKQGAPDLQR